MSNFSRRRAISLGAVGAAGIAAAVTQGKKAIGQTQPISQPEVNPNGEFADKVVLITGATSGIGEAAARAFAAQGATVHFCGRRQELGQQVAQSIVEAGGKASYQPADVRNEGEVKAFVDGCIDRYGKIDIAFNNAGIAPPPAALADTTVDMWDNVMSTNIRGIFLAMKYQIPQMVTQGGGAIVNMSSLGGHEVFPNISPYHASKFAVEAITKAAAKEYAAQNIRVNAIAPGLVDTAMTDRQVKDWEVSREDLASGFPLNRISSPEEQVRVVMFMSSPAASYMTGAVVSVDGGGA